jgi:hypothetical protein
VDETLREAARDYQEPAYLRERLRYQISTFQRLRNDGIWEPLRWLHVHSDREPYAGIWRVDLDVWSEIVLVDDQLWAATAAGWLPFELDNESRIDIDPDRLHIVRDPSLVDCTVTDTWIDGSEVIFRCNSDSNRVYRGILDATKDSGAFRSVSDPFAAASHIEKLLRLGRFVINAFI